MEAQCQDALSGSGILHLARGRSRPRKSGNSKSEHESSCKFVVPICLKCTTQMGKGLTSSNCDR